MSKIKINKGKRGPDPEKMRKHKNFGRLMTDYDKATKPLYKRLLYKEYRGFLAILLIILALVLIFEFGIDHDTNPKKTIPPKDSTDQPVTKPN